MKRGGYCWFESCPNWRRRRDSPPTAATYTPGRLSAQLSSPTGSPRTENLTWASGRGARTPSRSPDVESASVGPRRREAGPRPLAPPPPVRVTERSVRQGGRACPGRYARRSSTATLPRVAFE